MYLIFLVLFHIFLTGAKAQYQQTPPQHAPNTPGFPESRREKILESLQNQKKNADQDTGQTIEWEDIPLVKKWIIVVALDPDFREVIAIGESHKTSLTLPLLSEGDYYFYADGLFLDRHMGRTRPAQITIKSSQSPNAGKRVIIMTPENEARLVPFPKFRIAWNSIKEAVSYRFQFWDESELQEKLRNKIIPKPRWITEIKQNWIEIHDVPYASFMYLEEGDYRFDVTPIFTGRDGNKNLGTLTSSKIIVTRNSFLKKKQVALRLGGGYAPRPRISSKSAASGVGGDFGGTMTQFLLEFESYFASRIGFSVDAALDNIKMGVVATPTLVNFGADFHHRSYLSQYNRGWMFDWFVGLKSQQFAEIERDVDPKKISYPTILGPRLGLRFIKRFESPLEIQLKTALFIPMQASGTVKPSDSTYGVLNYLVSLHFRYYASSDFAWWMGGLHEVRRAAYAPNQLQANSTCIWKINALQFGVQFGY